MNKAVFLLLLAFALTKNLRELSFDTSYSNQRNRLLTRQNEYRAKHGVPNMTVDTALQNKAQEWAEHLATIGSLVHSDLKLDGKSVGENIYSKSSSAIPTITGDDAIDKWYGENVNYDYSNPGYSSTTGHFTQVVWKSSTKVGCGIAATKEKINGWFKIYVVCNYSPAGNMNSPSYFKANVLPTV